MLEYEQVELQIYTVVLRQDSIEHVVTCATAATLNEASRLNTK